jgi:hypothetical protein
MSPYVPAVHYLVDLYDSPLSSAKINDVIAATTGTSEINGNLVVRVPGDVSVQNPADLADLLTQKYAGLLAAYAGFTEIVWDDLLDPLHVDLTYAGYSGKSGDRSTVAINPGAQFQSTLISPVPGVAPSQAVVTWESFKYVDDNPRDGRLIRWYCGLFSDDVSACEVSFNGGISFYGVTDGGVVNIPLASQGTDFIIRITNTSADEVLHLGSWAVLY